MIYRREDCVGLLRHLLIFAVDGFVIWVLAICWSIIAWLIPGPLAWLPVIAFLILAWFYLAVLKPSRFRSLGYWIADARIVTFRDERPSPWRMTLRLLWLLNWFCFSPIGWIIDLNWALMNRERQMLRDLVLQTRLVRNRAQPVARGKISSIAVFGLGYVIHAFEVRELAPVPDSAKSAD